MGDSRFGIFLIACNNVLRFYAFTVLSWILFTSMWFSVRLVILQHMTVAANPLVWQKMFEETLAFAFDPKFYYIAFAVFMMCAIIAALGSAWFFKRMTPEHALDGKSFLITMLIIDLAVVLILMSSKDRIT